MITMVEVLLRRQPTVRDTTFGDLFVGGQWRCYTLEDAIRPTKLYGRTAIPAGRYRVVLVNSPKFGPETLSLEAVPGYAYIRIHAGNDDEDTDGCILVGTAKVEDPDGDGGNLLNSRAALAALKGRLVPAIRSGEQVWITIENPNGAGA